MGETPASGGPDVQAVRHEVREWLSEHWHGTDDADWRRSVVAAGWAAPSWPVDKYGRGWSRALSEVVAAEFAEVGATGAAVELTPFHKEPYIRLLGDPLLAFGGPEVCREYLPRLLSGELGTGCLLYSEPGAGSDLAAVQTRADRDGEDYIVNGQKIWTTAGRQARFGLLLARTDWDVPKHAGLSFFVVPMDLPGIDVRPIRQITGEADFNEVFLTDVRVPARGMIGSPGEGWKVLQVALAAERSGMGGARPTASKRKGMLDAIGDLVEAARRAGRADDPVVRQELMRVLSWRLTNKWTGQRAMTEGRRAASSLVPVVKLAQSRVLHSASDLAFRLQGQESLRYDYDEPMKNKVDRNLMFSFINSIGGGSDQIQRNIIGERVLGLPKGFEADKGVPFKDVRRSSASRPVSGGQQ